MTKPSVSPRRSAEDAATVLRVTAAAPATALRPPSLPISRRCLLHLSVLGVTASACEARAQQPQPIRKASKKVAGYIDKDHASTQDCAQCHFYIAPFDCMLVEGPVSPWGYCNYFAD